LVSTYYSSKMIVMRLLSSVFEGFPATWKQVERRSSNLEGSNSMGLILDARSCPFFHKNEEFFLILFFFLFTLKACSLRKAAISLVLCHLSYLMDFALQEREILCRRSRAYFQRNNIHLCCTKKGYDIFCSI